MRTTAALCASVVTLASALIGCADGRTAGEIRVLLSDDALASGVVVECDGVVSHARRPVEVDPAVAIVVGRGTRTPLDGLADAELVVVLGPEGDLVALDERTMRVDLARIEGEPGAVARLASAIGADLAPTSDGAWELLALDPWSTLAGLRDDPPGVERVLPVLLDPLGDLDGLRIAATPDPGASAPSSLEDRTLPSAALLGGLATSNPELERVLAMLGDTDWAAPRARSGRGRVVVHAPRPGRFAALSWVLGGGGCGMSWSSTSRRQLAALELGGDGAATMCGEREERSWLGGNAGIDYGEDAVRISLAGSWREVERGTVDIELREVSDACPGAVGPRLAEHELLREPVTMDAGAAGSRRLVLRCAAVAPLDDARWGDELLACRDLTPPAEARAAGGLDTGGDLLEGSWVLLGRGHGIAMFGERSYWEDTPPTRVAELPGPASTAGAAAFPAAIGAPGIRSDAESTRGHCVSFAAIASPPPAGVIRLGDDLRGPRARARLERLCSRAR